MSELTEKLSDLEHEQWISWSKYTVQALKDAGLDKAAAVLEAKWSRNWIPYEQLSEELKEKDRKWARKILLAFDEHGVSLPECNINIGSPHCSCDMCDAEVPG